MKCDWYLMMASSGSKINGSDSDDKINYKPM